jgi:hypothetical protein
VPEGEKDERETLKERTSPSDLQDGFHDHGVNDEMCLRYLDVLLQVKELELQLGELLLCCRDACSNVNEALC